MDSRRVRSAVLGTLTVLVVLGLAAPVIASPGPVSGCPPCGRGFISATANHGLDTEVQHGEATVRVHKNGSATWTVRVVPTNESVRSRLAENRSLAREVAADSFGTRYGRGIEHELISATVAGGAFVMRYRTIGVVSEGPFGTQVLTYFRDSPRAWVYTELGADELTVVAPPGMTVVRGFGDVTGNRMTATELPGVRDGPFVVFATEGSAVPGLYGTLAVVEALWGVIVRNAMYFVALPGIVLIGGFAGIRRVLNPKKNWNPTRLGSLVATGGAVLIVRTLVSAGDALPTVTGNLLLGGFGGVALIALGGGAVLIALGASVAVSGIRRHLTGLRLVGAGVVIGIVAMVVTAERIGTGAFHQLLPMAVALLPVSVALGWVDAHNTTRDSSLANRLFIGLSLAIIAVLIVSAPLMTLGEPLFYFLPILLTVAAVAGVIAAIPLYLLGAAGANAELT